MDRLISIRTTKSMEIFLRLLECLYVSILSTVAPRQVDVLTERCSDLVKTLLHVAHRNVLGVTGESPPLVTVETSSPSPISTACMPYGVRRR